MYEMSFAGTHALSVSQNCLSHQPSKTFSTENFPLRKRNFQVPLRHPLYSKTRSFSRRLTKHIDSSGKFYSFYSVVLRSNLLMYYVIFISSSRPMQEYITGPLTSLKMSCTLILLSFESTKPESNSVK